jgi:hypothetical protein
MNFILFIIKIITNDCSNQMDEYLIKKNHLILTDNSINI